MFFEASSIECRKTIFDVTKVTYNMYTCYTCCMSKEMMEMDDRDSATRRKSRRRDIDGIFGIVLMKIGQDSKYRRLLQFKRAKENVKLRREMQ